MLDISQPVPHIKMILDDKAAVTSLACERCAKHLYGATPEIEHQASIFIAKHKQCLSPDVQYIWDEK